MESRPIAKCTQIEPIPDTPQSPPDHERGQNAAFINDPWSDSQTKHEPEQAHITVVAVSTSGMCGNRNLVARGHCMVCGKSFETTKGEIPFDYLERTHLSEEAYLTRLRRRNAFEARMSAVSFILVPGGGGCWVSQATACVRNRYQVAPNKCGSLPLPPMGFAAVSRLDHWSHKLRNIRHKDNLVLFIQELTALWFFLFY